MLFEKEKNEPDWNETRFQDFLSSLKTKLDRLELKCFTVIKPNNFVKGSSLIMCICGSVKTRGR
jgi:hypothetical protein